MSKSVIPDAQSFAQTITQTLMDMVSRVPDSDEAASSEPAARARAVAKAASMRAAAISGALALPPGPLSLATVLPDLLAIWRLQQGMVADIAAIYGKSAELRREAMIYCLFRHGGAALVRDLVSRAGERFIVQPATLVLVQQVLQRIGVHVSQKVLGRTLTRWVPLIGAVGVGAYAWYDTDRVAATAIELFENMDAEMAAGVSADQI